MATQSLTRGERTSRRVAASYRKQGYRVVVPDGQEALPTFLHGCHPDLIAEREDDHVVVEIKPAGALRGANDLVDLAERVAQQPGWRLELVTFRDRDPDADNASPAWLSEMLRVPGEDVLERVYRLEVLSFLLRGIAAQAGIRAAGKTERTLAQELAFDGRIDEAMLTRIEAVFDWRDNLMRRRSQDPAPSVELETLCRDILAQAQQEAAE